MNKLLLRFFHLFFIFSISVFAGQISLVAQVVCNDLVNVTLDLNCSAEVLPDMILEGGHPSDNMTHDVELYFDRNLRQLVPGSPFLEDFI